MADHQYGADYAHTHDGLDADHDHDNVAGDGSLEENPIWIADHVTLVSVGMDIGSSGTQVVFSKMNLRRFGEDLSSRYYTQACAARRMTGLRWSNCAVTLHARPSPTKG